jgi:hypothetical protein
MQNRTWQIHFISGYVCFILIVATIVFFTDRCHASDNMHFSWKRDGTCNFKLFTEKLCGRALKNIIVAHSSVAPNFSV